MNKKTWFKLAIAILTTISTFFGGMKVAENKGKEEEKKLLLAVEKNETENKK